MNSGRSIAFALVDGKANGHDRVRPEQNRTLEPVRAAVDNDEGAHEYSEYQRPDLEALEVERQRLVDTPADDNEQRNDEHGDLRGASHSDAKRHVEPVFVCEDDRGRVLGRVAGDGQQNARNESLGHCAEEETGRGVRDK